MENVLKLLGAAVLVVFLVFVAAVFGGTILWLIWPTSIPVLFPSAVSSGILAANLSWWVSVKITWVFGLLIKGSQAFNSKND